MSIKGGEQVMMPMKLSIRIAFAIAALASVIGLPPESKAGDSARAIEFLHKYLDECAAPKNRKYDEYVDEILKNRPTISVPPMSIYCTMLYGSIRELDSDLPDTPPETYSQAFAKVVFLHSGLPSFGERPDFSVFSPSRRVRGVPENLEWARRDPFLDHGYTRNCIPGLVIRDSSHQIANCRLHFCARKNEGMAEG